MANCGFKIIKNGSNFVVGINHDQDTFSDTSYALSVNGLAAFYGNPRILGVQYPGFIYHTRATNAQAVGEQFVVCVTSGNYYSPRYQAFRTYTYNSSTGAANSSYHETFNLPTVNAGRTNSSEFSILTSKNAVTIAQGGTGKTTATEAWIALGGGASGKHADSYFALAAHEHAAGDITSGTLPIARGGTNATTAANARTQLGLGTAATHAHGDYVTIADAQTITGGKTFSATVTITSHLDMKGGLYYRWYKSTGTTICAFIAAYGSTTDTVPPQICFYEYGYNTSTGARLSSYERFILPAPSSTLTTHAYYSILTTKSAVTIAQGGTGKTTATEAWTALGGGASGKHADSYFALADHNHAAGDITSGTLAVARGGTGVTANPSMLTNLASTTAAGVFAASPRPGVTGILPVAHGGTGASAAEAGTITYTTNSHIASVAALSVYRVGKMGVLLATGQTLKAYGSSSYIGVGTIAAGWRPKVEVTQRVPLASGNWILRITTGGVIQFNKSTSESGTFYTTMVFPIA